MTVALRRALCLLFAVSPLSLAAKHSKPAEPMPRVLVIGDSVYSQHMRDLPKGLAGFAAVMIPRSNDFGATNSHSVVENLDWWLGRVDRDGKPLPEDTWPSWELIHFNVGLGDLIYRAPNMESFRVLPIHAGGVVATSPKDYEKNLDALVRALKTKAPAARLVWASTTPIRHSANNVFRKGSEVEYNAIAQRVMKRHGVPINDMYSHAKSVMNMDKPAGRGADPFHFDNKPIHAPVVEIIGRELKIKLPEDRKNLANAE
jgi:hypothetical protein